MSVWDVGGAYANTATKLQALSQGAEAFPAGLARAQSATRLNNANAAILEDQVASERKLAEIMRGMDFGQDESPSESIIKMAGAATRAGDPRSARDFLLRASQVRAAEAREVASNATAARAEATHQMKLAESYNQLLSSVRSQEDLNRANFLFASEFGEEGLLKIYDPQQVEMARQSTIRYRDKVYADHTAAMEKIARLRAGNTAGYRKELLRIREADYERKLAADKRREKEGGKDVGAPSTGEITAAENLLSRQGRMKGLDTATQRTAKFDLASRARALRRDNAGLDAGEALERAYQEQVQEGYYTTKKATLVDRLLRQPGAQEYSRPGMSVRKPLTVPQDRAQLKPQNFYATPKGVLQYIGKGQWKVPEPEPSGGAEEPPDDEDYDDEEE